MPTPPPATPNECVTAFLADLRAGRREALDQVLPLLYHELRRAARRERGARPSATLSTTALVHELYLKLAHARRPDWRDRAHFLGAASVAMRHILVDRARRRTADKRGGAGRMVTLDDALDVAADPADREAESLLALHDALEQLAAAAPRLARVVECRFFGGLTEQETAEALGVTERTVRRDWTKARGFLYQALATDATTTDATALDAIRVDAHPVDARPGDARPGDPTSVDAMEGARAGLGATEVDASPGGAAPRPVATTVHGRGSARAA